MPSPAGGGKPVFGSVFFVVRCGDLCRFRGKLHTWFSGGLAETQAELGGGLTVAEKTEGAEVREVALTSAFGYGEDVVGVPEGAAGGDGFEAVYGQASGAGSASGASKSGVDGDGVGLAEGAAATIAGEDLIAEVAGVGAEAVLVDAVVGAEGAAAAGKDFEVAPAAEGEAVGAEGEELRRGATAGKGAGEEHGLVKGNGGWVPRGSGLPGYGGVMKRVSECRVCDCNDNSSSEILASRE